jgi:hypothetical protein
MIVVRPADDKGPVRYYSSLKVDRVEGGYKSTMEIMANKDSRQQLIETALEEFKTLERKYERLLELASVFNEVRRTRERVTRERQLELSAAA